MFFLRADFIAAALLLMTVSSILESFVPDAKTRAERKKIKKREINLIFLLLKQNEKL